MRIFMFVLLLTGCATTAGYEKILNSWVGDNADHLVSSWGPPASSYQLTDGGEFFNTQIIAMLCLAEFQPRCHRQPIKTVQ